ncbi:MAG TPA: hypothetical protein VG206_08335 [Terriglobia bacterium]|nr:hypothetical protein [Terriglobia bacterium]
MFRGRVLGQKLVGHTQATVRNLDGTTSTIEGPGYYRVRFSVLEMLKGEPQPEVTILTNEQESACRFAFADGGDYVVFTYSGDAGELWTSKCSRTHALRTGEDDPDLSWMRGLATAPAGATIYGKLVLPNLVTGLDGPATITVRGPENHHIATDEKGEYALRALSAGQYTVSAAVPPGLMTGDAVK